MMLVKEKISIQDFDDKSYQIRVVEPYDVKALLTHYLYNLNSKYDGSYENEAISVLEDYIAYNFTEKNITLNTKDVIRQFLFEINEVPFPAPKNPRFTFIDLFAGVGGFRIALQNLQGKCVYTSEWNKDAQKTYMENYGEVPFGDITSPRIKDFIPNNFDLLCAGFPCQAFSIAGYQKGFADSRGTLFFDLEQIIEKHRPKAVFLENVKNLVSHDKGNTFKIIREILSEKLGYKIYYKVLNSMTHANIPQNRERIFIVGFDPKQIPNYDKFMFPDPIELTTTIHDYLEKGLLDSKYYYSKNHKYYNTLESTVTNVDTIYQWRRVYVRENKNNVCPTLTANMGAGGHNVPIIKDEYGIRKLTPKECFALQGFPMEYFKFPSIANSKLYMQAGNSVTVPLIQRIASEILKVLNDGCME